MINDEKIPVGTAEDLTGKEFGRLTVLYRIKNLGKTSGAKWRCQCSCGKTVDVLAANLKRNHTLSCGCLQKEITSKKRLSNEIGNRYGRLEVIERAEDYVSPKGRHKIRWKCKCDCGNITIVNADSLRKGVVVSCGCYHKEQVGSRCDKKYIGQTYHFITVLNRVSEIGNGKESHWNCKCNLCGKEFILTTGKLKTQISCGCLQDSYGVTIIKSLLNNNNINFETEKIFDDCIFEDTNKKARFDFYVENKYIIEFDGPQHFTSSGGWNTAEQVKETQQRDFVKNNWCKKNNIPLIRIPYWVAETLTINDLMLNSKYLVLEEEDNG